MKRLKEIFNEYLNSNKVQLALSKKESVTLNVIGLNEETNLVAEYLPIGDRPYVISITRDNRTLLKEGFSTQSESQKRFSELASQLT